MDLSTKWVFGWWMGMVMRGMGMKSMEMGIPRAVQGLIYSLSGYGVPIPYYKMANPNTNTWV